MIDDNEISNYVNRNLLEWLKITEDIDIVTDGKQALEYLVGQCVTPKSECPELIILDHHMPVMDGLELMHALNAVGFLKENKVVFLLLSIQSRKIDVDVFKQLGVQEFTNKPLSEKDVMDVYRKYWSGDPTSDHH